MTWKSRSFSLKALRESWVDGVDGLVDDLLRINRIVGVQPPFETDIEYQRHYTFLDTVGRPTVVFKSKNLTDKHTGLIYVRLSFI